MEKWYRYLLMFLIVWLIRYVRKINALSCVMLAENPLNTIILRPNESNWHPPFDCWNSQLQLSTKDRIARYYNEFRDEMAKNQLILAYKMSWHWVLEKEAVSIALQNPTPRTAQMPARTVYGVGHNMICEESIAKFKMKTVPLDLAAEFLRLLTDEDDFLDNFDNYGNLRRSSVTYFACSFVVSGDLGTLICVYCAFATGSSDNPIEEVPKKCPSSMTYYNSLPHRYLCIPKNSLYDLYGCDQPSRIKEICPEPEPESWKNARTMAVTFLYPVTNNREGTYYVVEQDNMKNNDSNKILPCEQLGEKCPPMLPKWAYAYNLSIMSSLNSASVKQRSETLGYGDNNVVVKIVQDDTVYYRKASCCLYLFLSFIILFVIVSVLVFFTYRHSKINSIKT